jgi:hypothetical protein
VIAAPLDVAGLARYARNRLPSAASTTSSPESSAPPAICAIGGRESWSWHIGSSTCS